MVFNRLFESRAISYQTMFASGDSIDVGNLAGTSVNSDSVFQVNAIFRPYH
jgi:hypothetical protein